LTLRYHLNVRPADLRISAPQAPGAADGLWQHTCCEAFIGEDAAGSTAYREFNFSPSGQWAAYRFVACRQRDMAFRPPGVPRLAWRCSAAGGELEVVLPGPLLPAGASLPLGLSVVLEAADGSKSYWALTHGAAQPDFHLNQSFSLKLKATSS